jgi:hypothetical protein
MEAQKIRLEHHVRPPFEGLLWLEHERGGK